jgi:hypothetical protein
MQEEQKRNLEKIYFEYDKMYDTQLFYYNASCTTLGLFILHKCIEQNVHCIIQFILIITISCFGLSIWLLLKTYQCNVVFIKNALNSGTMDYNQYNKEVESAASNSKLSFNIGLVMLLFCIVMCVIVVDINKSNDKKNTNLIYNNMSNNRPNKIIVSSEAPVKMVEIHDIIKSYGIPQSAFVTTTPENPVQPVVVKKDSE